MTWQTAWSVFWRTFAQITLAAVLAIQVPELVDSSWIHNTAEALGLALFGAFLAGLVAVLWAFAQSLAVTPLEKALRSAAQALAGVLGGVVVTQVSDVLALGPVLVGGAITVVLAFVVTFFQYQGPVPARPSSALSPNQG
jgi:hypothetical protein